MATHRSYRTEFGPTYHFIPPWVGGLDVSWGNDVCPSWEAWPSDDGEAPRLFVDAADASARENGPDSPRFTIVSHPESFERAQIHYAGDDEDSARTLWQTLRNSGGRL